MPTKVHPEALRKALVGERWPSIKILEAVAGLLDVSPDVFGEHRINKVREAIDPELVGYEQALEYADRLRAARGTRKSRTPT